MAFHAERKAHICAQFRIKQSSQEVLTNCLLYKESAKPFIKQNSKTI